MTPQLEQIYDRIGGWLTPEEEADLLAVATHEAGHAIVAAHFGLDVDELVLSGIGVAVHRHGSSLQNAAISFGGIFAEVLLNAPVKGRVLPQTPLTGMTVCKWVDKFCLHQLSIEDREGIAGHPNKYESARLAFEILSTGLDALAYTARRLAEKCRDRFCASTYRTAQANEREINQFMLEQKEAADAKAAEKKLRQAVTDAERIVASLPPVPLPREFSYKSFVNTTGASETEIEAFCAFKVLRERNQLGLGGVPDVSLKTAIEFFREHAVQTRDSWLYQARGFFAWRKGELKFL